MPDEQEMQALKAVPLFQGFSDKDLARVAEITKKVHHEDGEVLVEPAAEGEQVGVGAGSSTRQLRPLEAAITRAPIAQTEVTPWIRPSTRLCRLSLASPSALSRATRP